MCPASKPFVLSLLWTDRDSRCGQIEIAALRHLKRLVPSSTLLVLYRSFVLSHFEYCNSLLIGIGKTLNKKLEDANHYGLRTIMNLGRSINYESTLRIADINTLEHRRIEQSLTIFYKCYKENGPSYLADLFEPRITPYNLRNTGLNVTQNSYNSKFRHNSHSFVISRIWKKKYHFLLKPLLTYRLLEENWKLLSLPAANVKAVYNLSFHLRVYVASV